MKRTFSRATSTVHSTAQEYCYSVKSKMIGKSFFWATLIMVGLLPSYTTAKALRMASQEVLPPHPTGMHPDAYDNFVKSCLSDEESSNTTNPKEDIVYRKTVAASGSNYNAFNNDINACLFNGWTTSPRVLSGPVQCTSSTGGSVAQLCYGLTPPTAQFAVCYDTTKLIPIFTGHVFRHFTPLKPPATKPTRPTWRENKDAKGALFPPKQAMVADYNPTPQIRAHPHWNVKSEYFCSRGHLTPKGDFRTVPEQKMTFVVTNAAPQWQKFNNKNWAAVENAVREYSHKNNRDIYIFTGTGGEIHVPSGGTFKLQNRVTAPKFYWKAVCDPVQKQSIVFVAENNIEDKSTTKKIGCNGVSQTSQLGVVLCYGLKGAKGHPDYNDFQLPPFDRTSCGTDNQGTFLNTFIKLKK